MAGSHDKEREFFVKGVLEGGRGVRSLSFRLQSQAVRLLVLKLTELKAC